MRPKTVGESIPMVLVSDSASSEIFVQESYGLAQIEDLSNQILKPISLVQVVALER